MRSFLFGCACAILSFLFYNADNEEYVQTYFTDKPVFILYPFDLKIGKHILRMRYTEIPSDNSQPVQAIKKVAQTDLFLKNR